MTDKLLTPSELARSVPAAKIDPGVKLGANETIEALAVQPTERGWEFHIGDPAHFVFIVPLARMEAIARAALGIPAEPIPDLSPAAEAAQAVARSRSQT